jgi:hypothetical protein
MLLDCEEDPSSEDRENGIDASCKGLCGMKWRFAVKAEACRIVVRVVEIVKTCLMMEEEMGITVV